MKPLTPYLFFDGNCRKAMEFYEHVFGGELEVMTYADAPEDACGGDSATKFAKIQDKVMHACLTKGNFSIMASDNPMGKPVVGDNVQLSVNLKTIPEVEKLFQALGEGGNITMPLEDTFWGAHFGTLTDKFGIHWMVSCLLE